MDLDQRTEIVAGAERPLLRKWALSPAGTVALAQEADRLERARHPGVVVLVDAADDHLDLEWAGAETLALTRLTRTAAAQTLTTLATTVADLHDLGIVHGRIDESHVVIGPDLQPRLCGLRGPEPGRPEPGPADDVADLGLLLQRALGMGVDQDLVPERRWRTWPRSGARDRALEAIVERATDPDPARRPTARALARSMAEVVPSFASDADAPTTTRVRSVPRQEARSAPCDPVATSDIHEPAPASLPSTPERAPGVRLMAGGAVRPATTDTPPSGAVTAPAPEVWTDLTAERDPTGDRQDLERSSTGDTSRQPPRPARSIPVTLVVGVGLLIVAAALVTLRQPSAGGTDQLAAAVTRPVGRATIVGAAPSTTSSSLEPPTSKAAPTPSSNRVTVEFSGATYQVGEPGDRVAVADWDCDGAASAALVRPSTGEIFVFDGWPGTGEVTVTARARIARARELVGTPPGPECRSPRVRLDDGTLAALPTEAGD